MKTERYTKQHATRLATLLATLLAIWLVCLCSCKTQRTETLSYEYADTTNVEMSECSQEILTGEISRIISTIADSVSIDFGADSIRTTTGVMFYRPVANIYLKRPTVVDSSRVKLFAGAGSATIITEETFTNMTVDEECKTEKTATAGTDIFIIFCLITGVVLAAGHLKK